MKLKVGQTVELNNGEVHEVTRKEGVVFFIGGFRYESCGAKWGLSSYHPLSVKRIIKEPDSKPEWPDLSNPDKVPLKDMTNEERGALLWAAFCGEEIQVLNVENWVSAFADVWEMEEAYRVKPAAPSWLPLEVGKVYVDEGGVELRCIAVEGNNAWLVLKEINDTEAYVWDANTGKAKHLSWNLIGPAEDTEGEET